MDQEKQEAIMDFNHALLSISALAQHSVEAHEQIFSGILFFSKMAFDIAPSEQVARDTILAGIDTAFDEHQEES